MATDAPKKKQAPALVEHYEPLATLIADLVVAAMGPRGFGGEPKFDSQHDCPLSRRVYLAAARRGAFPNFCVGKTIFCRRADLHAFIEKWERSVPCDTNLQATDEIGALLDQASIRRHRGRR